jgi:hypothetical protein
MSRNPLLNRSGQPSPQAAYFASSRSLRLDRVTATLRVADSLQARCGCGQGRWLVRWVPAHFIAAGISQPNSEARGRRKRSHLSLRGLDNKEVAIEGIARRSFAIGKQVNLRLKMILRWLLDTPTSDVSKVIPCEHIHLRADLVRSTGHRIVQPRAGTHRRRCRE